MNHKYLALIGLFSSLGFAIFVDLVLFTSGGLGLNLFLVQSLFLGILFTLHHQINRRITLTGMILAALTLAHAGVFVIWTNTLSLGLNMTLLIVLNTTLILHLFGSKLRVAHIPDGAIVLFRGAIDALRGFTLFLELPAVTMKDDSAKKVFRGLIFALPFLLIFLALFIDSDLVLQNRLENIFEDLDENGLKTIRHLVSIVFVFGAGVMAFGGLIKSSGEEKPNNVPTTPIFTAESLIALGLVNALFLAFILFQANYLFGGEATWQTIENLSYAEYAKNGFGELAAVCGLVIFLLATVRYLVRNSSRRFIRLAQVTLMVQAIVVAISAFQRLALYVDAYGFTVLRLFGFWALGLVVGLLIILAVHIIFRVPTYRYTQHAILFTSLAVLGFTASTPEALAIRLQLTRTTAEKPFELSDYTWDATSESYAIIDSIIHNESVSGIIQKPVLTSAYCHRHDDQLLRRDDSSRDYARYFYQEFYYKQVTGRHEEKGTREYRKWNAWKSWNLMRATVPRFTIPFESNKPLPETFSDEILQEYCTSIGIEDAQF